MAGMRGRLQGVPAVPVATSASIVVAYIAPLLILAALYAWSCVRSARVGTPVPRWRQACTGVGLVLLGAGFIVLAAPSRHLLALHALQDILIGDIGGLFLALGLTGPVVAPLGRIPGVRLLRVVFHPLPALLLWLAAMFVWHIPSLYQSALLHSDLHALQLISSAAAGLVMWVCLLGPVPQPRWFGDGARLGFALLVRMGGALLGNLLLWANHVSYDSYLQQDAARQFSPLADQNLAGAVILVEQTVMLLVVFAWLYRRSAAAPKASGSPDRDGERRRAASEPRSPEEAIPQLDTTPATTIRSSAG